MGRLAAAILLALLVCAGLAAPAGAARRPVDFEQRVPVAVAPTGAAAHADAHAHASRAGRAPAAPVLTAPRRFDLLGLKWARGEAHVELRVQRERGGWSRWIEVPHGEDAPAAGAASAPVWTGSARRYQLRGAHGHALPRGLRVHFVAVSRRGAGTAGAGANGDAAPARSAAERPAIVPRSQWDPTNACPPRTPPRYGRVDFAFVHHTESLASYTPGEAAAVVLAICRFHRNANGWLDIGYNLLVDRYGTVFEGRAGGVEQPVIGAQAGGWNSVSTGVSVIGSFSTVRPPAAAQRSLERVLAWKLALAGVPPLGTLTQTSYGGDENRWRAGTRVRFQRISGHRDGDHTTCPGDALYAALPQLRDAAAELHELPGDLLTSSPIGGSLAPGGPAQLTGRLALADGRRPVGASLTLQQRGDAGWTDLAALHTGADGVWSAAVPVTVNGAFRVVAADHGLTSPTVRAAVQPAVTARVAPQSLRVGRGVTLQGATAPAKPRVRVLVQRQPRPGAAWRTFRRTSVATDAAGAYVLPLRLTRPGVHRFTVTTAADATNAAGAAPVRTARVLRHSR